MKAIIIKEPFNISITDVGIPIIKDDEVLIKVISGGICGSDIGIYNGTNSLATYPRIIGHEYGGEIVEVGSNVSGLKVGDLVAVDPVRSCGKCYACRNDRHNVCIELEVTGVHRDGGFAEYVSTPAANVYPIKEGAIDKNYICLVEPYTIGAQVNHRGNIQKGDIVLIMGSGPIGICIMQVAKTRGAYVIMTDILDTRLALAKEMGADVTINVKKQDLSEILREYNNGEGIPVVIDTVCNVESFEQALELACPAGRVVPLGLINKPSSIAQVTITKKELTVVGSRLSNKRFPEVIEGFEKGILTPEKLCTRVFPYTQIEEAFRIIRETPEKVCKLILSF